MDQMGRVVRKLEKLLPGISQPIGSKKKQKAYLLTKSLHWTNKRIPKTTTSTHTRTSAHKHSHIHRSVASTSTEVQTVQLETFVPKCCEHSGQLPIRSRNCVKHVMRQKSGWRGQRLNRKCCFNAFETKFFWHIKTCSVNRYCSQSNIRFIKWIWLNVQSRLFQITPTQTAPINTLCWQCVLVVPFVHATCINWQCVTDELQAWRGEHVERRRRLGQEASRWDK